MVMLPSWPSSLPVISHVPFAKVVPSLVVLCLPTVGFNKRIGTDVKYLRGWKHNHKVKALNVVCQASGFQRVIPFFESETSQLLRKLWDEHWIVWAGVPSEIMLDSAQKNLAEPMTGTAEDQGCTVRQIAADAHWQLAKTENHGGWFNRILGKVTEQHGPCNQPELLECVTAAHVKIRLIRVHGHTPHQFVFGKNPHIPSNLMDEPRHVVPGTISLTEAAIERAQRIRPTARHAVLDLQDDRALKRALSECSPSCFQRFQTWRFGCLQISEVG